MRLLTFAAILATSASYVCVASAATPCKFYGKAEVGYSFSNNLTYRYSIANVRGGGNTTSTPLSDSFKAITATTPQDQGVGIKSLRGVPFGLGVGYNFSEVWRGDVVYNYLSTTSKPSSKSTVDSIVLASNFFMSQRSHIVMANAYYDFTTGYVSPFLTIGIGINAAKYKLALMGSEGTPIPADAANALATGSGVVTMPPWGAAFTRYTTVAANNIITPGLDTSTGITIVDGKTKTQFRVQVGAGFSIKASDAVYVDFTYRFSNAEKFNAFNSNWILKQHADGNDSAIGGQGGVMTYTHFKDVVVTRYWQSSLMAGIRMQF